MNHYVLHLKLIECFMSIMPEFLKKDKIVVFSCSTTVSFRQESKCWLSDRVWVDRLCMGNKIDKTVSKSSLQFPLALASSVALAFLVPLPDRQLCWAGFCKYGPRLSTSYDVHPMHRNAVQSATKKKKNGRNMMLSPTTLSF